VLRDDLIELIQPAGEGRSVLGAGRYSFQSSGFWAQITRRTLEFGLLSAVTTLLKSFGNRRLRTHSEPPVAAANAGMPVS
jgi:hypothetical protein